MCMSPPTQWFRDPPCVFSIFFSYSPMRGVAMKSVCSKEVSVGNGYCWNLTSSFVFVPQYYWMIFFIMWSVWSILIPYVPWIILMLRSSILRIFRRYSQRDIKILVLVFQSILCSLLPWVCHLFQQQRRICKSYTPMRIQNYKRSF